MSMVHGNAVLSSANACLIEVQADKQSLGLGFRMAASDRLWQASLLQRDEFPDPNDCLGEATGYPESVRETSLCPLRSR